MACPGSWKDCVYAVWGCIIVMRWIVVGEIHKYCMWFDENVEVLVKKFVVGCWAQILKSKKVRWHSRCPVHVKLAVKMVNGFRYYRALESVSMIASALYIPLLPFTHARCNFLQLGRRSGGRPQRAVQPHAVTCQHCDTHYFSRPRTRNLPIVGPTRYQ